MKYSITTKITIIFAIAFSLMCLLFVTFANIQQESALEKLKDRQISAMNYLVALYERGNPPRDLEHYFKNLSRLAKEIDVKVITDYVEGLIDFQNMITLFRVKKQNRDAVSGLVWGCDVGRHAG